MAGIELSLLWGGEERNFALRAKQIEALESDLNEGIGNVCYRVFSKVNFKFSHIRQTIYWGLIGGGASVTDATNLVRNYVDDCPMDPPNEPNGNLSLAGAILKAAYFGWETLPKLGEAPAGGETRPNEQTGTDTAPLSSAQA